MENTLENATGAYILDMFIINQDRGMFDYILQNTADAVNRYEMFIDFFNNYVMEEYMSINGVAKYMHLEEMFKDEPVMNKLMDTYIYNDKVRRFGNGKEKKVR